MSSLPDGEYKWIFHAKDHFSKITYAVPLQRKSMEETSQAIRTMFHLFGPSQILQHDNGGEFVGKIIVSPP
jgi:hypothetical protein